MFARLKNLFKRNDKKKKQPLSKVNSFSSYSSTENTVSAIDNSTSDLLGAIYMANTMNTTNNYDSCATTSDDNKYQSSCDTQSSSDNHSWSSSSSYDYGSSSSSSYDSGSSSSDW